MSTERGCGTERESRETESPVRGKLEKSISVYFYPS